MNALEYRILLHILRFPYKNQRLLSEETDISLGKINKTIKILKENNYLNKENLITEKTYEELKQKKPKNAIILAAGFGMRMIPINKEVPKGLLNVHGEIIIERIIKQLHEINVYDIDIVVGFMKEKFEYLIDKFDINLVYNKDYKLKNNLHSLKLLTHKISNTYIIPSDIWSNNNPFSTSELYSWYMINDELDYESHIKSNRKLELIKVNEYGNKEIGIACILENESKKLRNNISKLSKNIKYNNSYWENALFNKNKMIVNAKISSSKNTFEINTFEQLREIDDNSLNLNSDEIKLITEVLNINKNEIKEISMLKKGMTNRSFTFKHKNKKYIMRIPGEGTEKMINRNEEYEVYKLIDKLNLSDNLIYFNPRNGYKITEFIEGTRVCNKDNFEEVKKCIKKLKKLHRSKLKVNHEFNLYKTIEYYEKLWIEKESIYLDYKETKEKIYELKDFIDTIPKEFVLTHIDSIPDNFLLVKDEIKLIDWEYAAMQDPHLDIAMFGIYSLYDRKQIDKLIDIYFEGKCTKINKIKIYSYIAISGLMWSNWCEYKRQLGVEFGEYSLRQYRYAKEYYNIVKKELNKGEI